MPYWKCYEHVNVYNWMLLTDKNALFGSVTHWSMCFVGYMAHMEIVFDGCITHICHIT